MNTAKNAAGESGTRRRRTVFQYAFRAQERISPDT
jgi:hypothetical protein